MQLCCLAYAFCPYAARGACPRSSRRRRVPRPGGSCPERTRALLALGPLSEHLASSLRSSDLANDDAASVFRMFCASPSRSAELRATAATEAALLGTWTKGPTNQELETCVARHLRIQDSRETYNIHGSAEATQFGAAPSPSSATTPSMCSPGGSATRSEEASDASARKMPPSLLQKFALLLLRQSTEGRLQAPLTEKPQEKRARGLSVRSRSQDSKSFSFLRSCFMSTYANHVHTAWLSLLFLALATGPTTTVYLGCSAACCEGLRK